MSTAGVAVGVAVAVAVAVAVGVGDAVAVAVGVGVDVAVAVAVGVEVAVAVAVAVAVGVAVAVAVAVGVGEALFFQNENGNCCANALDAASNSAKINALFIFRYGVKLETTDPYVTEPTRMNVQTSTLAPTVWVGWVPPLHFTAAGHVTV